MLPRLTSGSSNLLTVIHAQRKVVMQHLSHKGGDAARPGTQNALLHYDRGRVWGSGLLDQSHNGRGPVHHSYNAPHQLDIH